jgi:hypothetical protein
MAEHDDIATRLALLERTMVSRDQLADREDKLLNRFEALLGKHERRMDEGMQHAFKVYGHDIADQLRALKTRLTEEGEQKLTAALKDVAPGPPPPPPKNDLMLRWGLPLGLAALVGGPGTVTQILSLLNAAF